MAGDGHGGRAFRELFPAQLEIEPSTVHQGEEFDTRQRLEEVLAALDPVDRAAIQFYVVEELSAADIARLLGLPNAKAVYNRVYRGLALLRSTLEKAGLSRGDL